MNRLGLKLEMTLDSVQKVVDNLAKGRGTVGKLLTDEGIYYDLKGTISNLNNSVNKISKAVDRIGREETVEGITDTIKKIDEIARNIEIISKKISAGQGTVGKLMSDEELYKELKETAVGLKELLKDIRQNPKKYLKIQIF